MNWMLILLLSLLLMTTPAQRPATFAENQCQSVQVSKGEIGEGQLKYCDNGADQEIYLSGELDIRPTDQNEDSAADLVALKKIIREFKKRDRGTFRVVTNNAGGGETDWHQDLIMAVEDACIRDCRIITEIKGRCESACNQLHITCVSNARTILHHAARTCEHATTDEANPKCNKRDPLVPGERDLCGPKVAVNEYEERCGRLTRGRNLSIDDERKKRVYKFIESLARKGVFDTTRLTCTPLPWAETDPTAVYRMK